MDEIPTPRQRLAEIARQVRDGWVRGRGPLTGLKALVAARQEAGILEAPHDYLAAFDEIVAAARTIAHPVHSSRRSDAPAQLEASVARLQTLCGEAVA